MEQRVYIAIDLKSFYASVECIERGLDPLTTNLVVADETRTAKTICLAVSPALKKYGIPGRPRLFEVIAKMKDANEKRRKMSHCSHFVGMSSNESELLANPSLEAAWITARPRMAYYMEYSTRIYNVYLKYIAPEDIHVYSIDEVFIDATHYLSLYGMSASELCMTMIRDVLATTGITATAGIGSNMYLAKVAMDIVAKKMKPDENGVRMAELDEEKYRRELWSHRPLTDFWRVGRGYAASLEKVGLRTMGDVARCALGRSDEFYNEELLYKLFGVNAELLIDHAFGIEPCTIADIKAYKPSSNSLGSGQVLSCPYEFEKARLVLREMTDLLVLELVEKKLVTDQMVFTVGYDSENLYGSEEYGGDISTDHYGRKIPKHTVGTVNLGEYTSSISQILDAVTKAYDKSVDRKLTVRRLNITAAHVIYEKDIPSAGEEQLSLFTDYEKKEREENMKKEALAREKRRQETVIALRHRFGKNAVLRGMNLEEGATAKSRNGQIGGHKA